MVFSELLLCACGRQGQHLFHGFKFHPDSMRSSPRHKLADEERQRMNYILEQIGLEKLTKSHACIASAPPDDDDLAAAIDLLSKLLQEEWQGESARICAGKALEHEFFSRGSSEQFSAAAARERIAGEKKRFKDVGSSLRQIERVRLRSPPPPLIFMLDLLQDCTSPDDSTELKLWQQIETLCGAIRRGQDAGSGAAAS
jgi:hypothetical protein